MPASHFLRLESAQSTQNVGRLLGRLLCLAFAVITVLFCHPASAQTLQSIVFSPPIGTLKVTSAAGTVYTGEVVYTYSYPSSTSSGSVFFGLSIGSTREALNGMTNLYLAATGAPTYVPLTGAANCPIKAASPPSVASTASYVFARMNGVCTFNIRVPVVISKDAGAVTGTFTGHYLRTNHSSMPCGAFNIGWAVWWPEAGICPFYSAPGVGGNLLSWPAIPYSTIGCTLTASSMTVNLPIAPQPSLANAGAVYGATPFNIRLQGCTWNSPIFSPLNVTAAWSFTQLGSNDTITTGVTNLGVQILDETLTPVVTGASRPMFVVVNGTAAYTKSYSARYIAVGGPASAGTFSATATFDLTYN